jgi:hypothetical protein
MDAQQRLARLSVGDVLTRSFGVFFGNFFVFVLLAVAVELPAALIIHYLVNVYLASGQVGSAAVVFSVVATALLGTIPTYIATGMIIYGVFRYLQDQPFTIGDCIQTAIGRLGWLFLTSLVAGLIITFGLLLFIVPGIYLALMYSIVAPAVIVERLGVGASLSRSASLTKGRRLTIFGIFIVVYIIVFLIGLIAGGIGGMFGTGWASVTISSIISGIGSAFNSVVLVVIYYCLRVDKEGIGIQQIADVFA